MSVFDIKSLNHFESLVNSASCYRILFDVKGITIYVYVLLYELNII